MSEAKRPYVPPRLVQVQKRMPGDNLAVGCKTNASVGPTSGSDPCETESDPCSTADTS